MNLQDEATCTRCKQDHGDLIYHFWRCPKLHTYWAGVVNNVNSVFKVTLPLEPRACLLGVLEEYEWEMYTREAIQRVLFQARKLIMVHWKSENPPTVREWIHNIGELLHMEKIIYQHREVCGNKRVYGLHGWIHRGLPRWAWPWTDFWD